MGSGWGGGLTGPLAWVQEGPWHLPLLPAQWPPPCSSLLQGPHKASPGGEGPVQMFPEDSKNVDAPSLEVPADVVGEVKPQVSWWPACGDLSLRESRQTRLGPAGGHREGRMCLLAWVGWVACMLCARRERGLHAGPSCPCPFWFL